MRASQPPNSDDELAEARVAENELEFVALLRAMVNHLMAAYGVASIADLPHAHELLCKAVEECAVEKGISHEAAAEIARRELGLPEPDA